MTLNPTLKQQLQSLPTDPGIYRYYDQAGKLLYVGKAKNLKNRVKSYFVDRQTSPKTKLLVSQINHLEYIIVASEIDALILEANLIRQHKPPFNIVLKDDKSHLYIKITTYQDFPAITTCRQTDMTEDSKALYFGPYLSGRTVRQTLRHLRKVFPYLAHRPPVAPGRRRAGQSFFYYNLDLGQAESADQWDKTEYRKQVFRFVHFLEGKRLQIMEELDKEMRDQAKQLNFEKAAQLKQQYDNLAYLAAQRIAADDYLQNPELMADKRQQGLDELTQALEPYFDSLAVSRLPSAEQNQENNGSRLTAHGSLFHPLHRVECYDISNTMGQQAVGSMVVFLEGQASKSHYRRFRIKQDNKPNDPAMLKEVLSRRFKRLSKQENTTDQSFQEQPSLLIIDGGKSQLNAALEVLTELDLNIPVVGMTKREEELLIKTNLQSPTTASTDKQPAFGSPNRSGAHAAFPKTEADATTKVSTDGPYTTIRLARGSEALFLIQRLRDEAHRFAIQYHKQVRAKAFLPPTK